MDICKNRNITNYQEFDSDHFEDWCCDVSYNSHIKMMFGSSLSSVVCRRVHVLFTLFVSVCI